MRQTRILIALLALAASTAFCFAADGITAATTPDGRKVFINSSDSPHSRSVDRNNAAPAESVEQPVRYVYWSNTQHRWKPVPRQSLIAQRARSAAAEVIAEAAQQPAPMNGQNDANTFFTPEKVNQAIEQAAARHNVDPDLVRAVIKVESNFNPHAVSRKGAMGLMQLMPDTARALNVSHPFDPTENIDAGVRHLRKLLDNFGGDLARSLAAYNAGSRAVNEHNGVPPYRETQNYVRQITALYKNGGPVGAGVVRHPIHVSRDSEGHLYFSNTD